MNYLNYNLFLYLLSPIIWLYFFYRGFKDRRYWSGTLQRLGLAQPERANRPIHLHCASVGETIAAIPLILQLVEDFPNDELLITTTTPTGKHQVSQLIAQHQLKTVTHCYLPIDWYGSVKRFIKRVNPAISILMETEIWPNLTKQLRINNIPVLLANARMSEKSTKKYLKHANFSAQIFSNISKIAAQYPSDAANFLGLGVAESLIKLVGSTKFDINFDPKTIAAQKAFAQNNVNGRACWIAASIHPAEFETILKTHLSLVNKIPDLLLIAVPRHPEEFSTLKNLCREKQLEFVSRSEKKPPKPSHSVMVGDTMGELTTLYFGANLAFVGGSVIDRGGHNPLEPAACGIPVIMGPSDYNFSDVCRIMKSYQTLETVANQVELEAAILATLSDQTLRSSKQKSTEKLFLDNRGSAKKIASMVAELLL